TDLFTVLGEPISGKDLILIFGGLFLVFKGTREIHHKIQDAQNDQPRTATVSTLRAVLFQILIVDVELSLDSDIHAVGMTSCISQSIPIIVTSILMSVKGMLVFSKAIVLFIERNPTIKILALSFLLLIGMLLMDEGFGHHIPK